KIEELISQTTDHSSDLEKAGLNREEIERILAGLRHSLKSENSSAARSFLQELRTVMTGAAGNIVAAGVLNLINQIMGTGVPSV
ncbi:MAG: hypothetical protein ACTHLY_07515, partial [Pseudolabrys sp.]